MKALLHHSPRLNKEPEPPAVSRPEVDIEALTHIDAATLEDSYVYVHCYFHNKWENMLIRIWKTTYLVDNGSGTRSKLIHAENISLAPVWTQIPDKVQYSFLLIFFRIAEKLQAI